MVAQALCPVGLLIGVVFFIATRAANSDSRSRKIGGAAAACGIAAGIPALLGPTFQEVEQTGERAACGALTLLLALAAVSLAIWSFRARARGSAGARDFAFIGLACGVANVFCGSGLLIVGSGTLTPSKGTERMWRSERHGFEITIPSEHWIEKSNKNVVADFASSRPALIAIVAEVRPASTDEEYSEALALGRKFLSTTPTTNATDKRGQNSHGNPSWIHMGDASNGKEPYFYGFSITRVGNKAVVMMIEGPYRMMSVTGRKQEAAALRTQAELFLGSVR